MFDVLDSWLGSMGLLPDRWKESRVPALLTPHCTALHCTEVIRTALKLTALHCTALHCTALQNTVHRASGCPALAANLMNWTVYCIINTLYFKGKEQD